jgi:hypothetical protein
MWYKKNRINRERREQTKNEVTIKAVEVKVRMGSVKSSRFSGIIPKMKVRYILFVWLVVFLLCSAPVRF